MHYKATDFGFEWGSARITRACSDEKKGWVVLLVKTPKEDLQIYVTKTGKVRVFGPEEWSKPDPGGNETR